MRLRFGLLPTVLVLAVSVILNCGCSPSKKRPPMGKVTGKVVYKGNPVPGVVVTFMTDGAPRSGIGTTDDNGSFQLTTFDTDDGAIVGTHKVTVSQNTSDPNALPMSPEDLAKKGPPPPPKGGIIPSKYADVKTTPLKNTVEPGPNNFTLELKD